MDNLAKARTLAVLVPAALLGGAYLSQYGFGLYPCEMCWWQRYPHFAALALGLLAFAVKPVARPLVLLAGLAILVGGHHRLHRPRSARCGARLQQHHRALRCAAMDAGRDQPGGLQFSHLGPWRCSRGGAGCVS